MIPHIRNALAVLGVAVATAAAQATCQSAKRSITGGDILHNYVNLNIGLRLTVGQAVAYSIQWIVAGVTIALLYRPMP